MTEFKASILSVNKKGSRYFFISAVVILLAVAALLYFQVIPFLLQIFSIIAWLFAVLKYVLQTKKQVLKKTVGELKISYETISIFNVAYNLHEVASIEIFISGWKSYKRSGDRMHPISDFHYGDKNFLTITLHNKITKCEFLLTSKENWLQLREHVMSWYAMNISLTESNPTGKTYGLETLMYKEIQLFKKSIQVSKTSAV